MTSTILSLNTPRATSRSCGPSGDVTYTRRLSAPSAPPTTAWSGTQITGSFGGSTWIVTSALMSGLRPSIGSSMVTRVWYTLTSEEAQSCMLETAATERTWPRSCLPGKASARTRAAWPCSVRTYSLSRYSSRSVASVVSACETSRVNGSVPTRKPARMASKNPVDCRSSPRTCETIASWTLVLTCIRFRFGMRMSFCPSLTCAPC